MILAVENMGLPVLSFDIESEKQSGYCTWSESLGFPIIGVNSTECSLARQRFNVAHELGHVLMHLPIANDADVRNTALHKVMEQQAHRFAGALLLPRRVLAQNVRYFDFEEFLEIKARHGISICAQIMRCRQLGYIGEDQFRELWGKAGRKGFRKPLGEPLDKNSKLEVPRMLARAVEALSSASELLLERVRNMLELPRVEEIRIFGRSLEVAADNVVRLRPFS
jgi:Zn-dependent peptidase ImmA (M78 family)